jgi:hypothetical protein
MKAHTWDFELALRGLLGEGAPPSASLIARLRATWQLEYENLACLGAAALRCTPWPSVEIGHPTLLAMISFLVPREPARP